MWVRKKTRKLPAKFPANETAIFVLAREIPCEWMFAKKFAGDCECDIIDLLMGLFRGAVFRHSGGALKQPIEQATETPTSTLALMGRFHSLMGRFPALMGRFTDFVLRGRFTS